MMLAFTIGWQEVLLILLFLLGVVVIPLPGRWIRKAARKPVTFSERFLAPPIENIHSVAEAFFCSYERGEYELVGKERFRLVFRRGEQDHDDGQVVLSLRESEPPSRVPVILRVLFQPRADALAVTVKHEARPRGAVGAVRRRKLSGLFQREAHDFQSYLRENFGAVDADEPRRRAKRITARQTAHPPKRRT